jgi:thiopeptide-type bacteriocin biosynthesis protein
MNAQLEHIARSNAPEFCHAGFFVLRTPLLPAEDLLGWSDGLTAYGEWSKGSRGVELAEAWRNDSSLLRRRLESLLERPEIKHALRVASPSMVAGISAWRFDAESKKGVQAERALVRYFARMAGRATPFGLFSGCSVGTIEKDKERVSALTLRSLRDYRITSRLDFDYLFALTSALSRDPELRSGLVLFPNSTLFRTADHWQYIESRHSGGRRSHHLSSLESDHFLEAVIERARSGARIADLESVVHAAADAGTVSSEDVRNYVEEIINSGCVVSTLTPLVTGPSALDDVIEQLGTIAPGGTTHSALQAARALLLSLDAQGIGVDPKAYEQVEQKLSLLPTPFNPAKLLQTDMTKPVVDAVLPSAVVDELRRTVELLRCFNHSVEPDEIRQFREGFLRRYEHARIPLLEALDGEVGIGFGKTVCESAPLLRGLQYSGAKSAGGKEMRASQQQLLTKLLQCVQNGDSEVQLTAEDIPFREDDTLADSFSVNCTVAASSAEALARGEFEIRLMGAVGPDGARLIGRFCHADDTLSGHVREYLRDEESHDPDAIFAEVVHLPEGRIGNVLCRPILRSYEIVYSGRSGAPLEQQIPASDLEVTVESGSIVLYSRSLGKRIVPRLTSAHGFMENTMAPVYRFLCYLQHQHGIATPGFGWGPMEDLPHLPRVRVGRVLVSLERWRLTRAEIETLAGAKGCDRFVAIQQLRERRGLPRWVVLEESDHSLPVDLFNALSVDAFVHVVNRTSGANVREMYPDPDALCVIGPEGHYYHELTVPLRRANRKPIPTRQVAVTPSVSREERTLGPGSEWLYWKLYSGLGFGDELLSKHLSPMIEEAQERGLILQWFFLRYQDPENHLRLRIRTDSGSIQEVFRLVSEWLRPFVNSGRLWKVQTDTYEREIERYGGLEAMLAAERIFHADSSAVLQLLSVMGNGDEGMDLRWQAVIAGIDTLLNDFGFTLPTKRQLASSMRDAMRKEYGAGTFMKQLIADRYRSYRQACQQAVEAPSAIVRDVCLKRSTEVRQAASKLHQLRAEGRLAMPVEELAVSYVHMHVNRVLRAAHRQHELILYDFLARVYESAIARERPKAPEALPDAESVAR